MRRRARFLVPAAGLVLTLAAAGVPAAPAAPSPPTAGERSTLELVADGIAALEENDFTRADALFLQAAEIDPRLAQAHLGLGLAALGEHNRRQTERSLRRALDLSGGIPEVRYAQGIARFIFDGPRAAEADLRAVITADPAFLEARYALGMAAARRGNLVVAADALREAIRIDTGQAAPHYQLGAVLARAGDLDSALRELSLGLAADPALLNTGPEDLILFVNPAAAPEVPRPRTFRMPVPLVRPTLSRPGRRAAARPSARKGEIPDWYLEYYMGLQLVDAGRWRDATVLLEHALATKDRSERMTVIADRLVDYTPHMHLAKAYHRLGVLREAFLHLELARNEENASPQALRALRVLLDKDRERPLIHLEPLPDRTTAEQVTIRGVIISRQAAERVEVAGHKALLRSAAPEEVEALLAEHGRGLEARHSQGVRFEIPDFRLGLGENLIRVRPFFGAAGDDGDLVETLIVRVRPASPAQDEAPGSPPGDGPATAGPSGAAP